MTPDLERSYALCQRLTRRASTSFYYPFFALTRPKRRAMCALYAFLRRADDLADSPGSLSDRRRALAEWRNSFESALRGEFRSPLLPALADTVSRYAIPPEYPRAVLDGVEMDLEHQGFEAFGELERYCYNVASAVGLCCIHVWGFRDASAIPAAHHCGLAFQLTNILRDLKEDAEAGRVYLPREDLRRFDYTAGDLRAGARDDRFRQLMEFEIRRAIEYYRMGAELERWLEPDGRRVFRAMSAIYRRLLDEIRSRRGDVFSDRVRLSTFAKLRIAARSIFLPSPSRN